MARLKRLVCAIGWMALIQVPFAEAPNPSTAPPAEERQTNQSIARVWDEQILAAIRIDTPHPPVHARNLFHLSVAMYDAWAAFDPVAVGYVYRRKHLDLGQSPEATAKARREAISYAAYRLLKERYIYSKSSAKTLSHLDRQMVELGYSTNNLISYLPTASGVGNSVYEAVSAYFLNDGCFQTNRYNDMSLERGGYRPVNPALVTGVGGISVANVNRWQPLAIANAVDQNGFPASPLQKFLGSQWLGVTTFGLTRSDSSRPWFDPGPPPALGGIGDRQFREDVVEVIRRSSQLDPDDGVTIDVSPGCFGNNSLGANDGRGHSLNPATGRPYAPNMMKRGDFGRILAEFWADGPNSETPPGHWNVIANAIADNPNVVKRLGGVGPVLDPLEWDVKIYFALNAAVHDAACAAWGLKRYYDGGRPISFIRYMGMLGQSTDPLGPRYHRNGLPLITNLIEVVTLNSAKPGGRHDHLPVGKIAILAWGGQPANPTNQHSGARWILAENWLPYQKSNFVTPSFPGFISGHSTFSRSAAEVLAAATGTPYFPGGLSEYAFPANRYLTFEQGPSEAIRLQWATYFDASDQAGLSRLWGGIHVSADDLNGRVVGSKCGKASWNLALKYFDGTIQRPSPSKI